MDLCVRVLFSSSGAEELQRGGRERRESEKERLGLTDRCMTRERKWGHVAKSRSFVVSRYLADRVTKMPRDNLRLIYNL